MCLSIYPVNSHLVMMTELEARSVATPTEGGALSTSIGLDVR